MPTRMNFKDQGPGETIGMPRQLVDVHILIMPGMNEFWYSRCLASLAGEPVMIHICPGIMGDTAKARTDAFRKGEQKYVAFVDPDDEVIPGIFTKLVNLLESDSRAVAAYSDEALIDESGKFLMSGWSTDPRPFLKYDIRVHNINGQHVHHLRVFRRDALKKCLPLKTKRMPEPVLMHDLSELGPLLHLAEVGYRWRIHKGNTFASLTQQEIQEALVLVIPSPLF